MFKKNKLKFHPAYFNLRLLLEQLTQMFEIKLKEKGLYLKIDVDSSIPREIFHDKNKILQILINLVSNALKFTQKGGILISLRFDQEDLKRLHFTVSDTGRGIKDEDLNKLFQSFGVLSESFHMNNQGVGLGLIISNGLVIALNNGKERIKVSSKFGQGTSFSFVIPQRYEVPFSER